MTAILAGFSGVIPPGKDCVEAYNMDYRAIANTITTRALEFFGSRLDAVLLYGSTTTKSQKPNDLDLIIVLKERETIGDFSFVGEQMKHYSIEMDIQIINTSDIRADYFSHDSHGQFFIKFLQKESQVLYGQNPFLNYFPKYSSQVISVLQKAQYYYFRAKKTQADDAINSIDSRFHRKKLLLMLADFWLIYNGECIKIQDKTELEKVVAALTKVPVVASDIKFLLEEGQNDAPWSDIFDIYQRYYFSFLDIVQKRITISSFTAEGIHIELRKVPLTKKLVILASGWPSHYDESEIATFFAIRNYDVATFHYPATGMSDSIAFGDPIKALSGVIKTFSQDHTYDEIEIIGNSYGGYAVLGIDETHRMLVNKIIAVSPVLNFRAVKGIETLPNFLYEQDKHWYRFAPGEFAAFINETSSITQARDKTYIIHGMHDDQISISEIQSFCDKNNIPLEKVDAGHLSFNRVSREQLYAIAKFL